MRETERERELGMVPTTSDTPNPSQTVTPAGWYRRSFFICVVCIGQ